MATLSEFEHRAAAYDAAAKPDRLTLAALAAILIGATFLNRFGLDLAQGGSIALSLPITLAALALLVVCGRVEVNVGRLIFYMLAIAALAMVTTVGPKVFSPNSFMLLAVTYACFVVQLAPNRIDYLGVLRLFQNFLLICSIAGVLQFVGQFIFPGPYLFSFDHIIPDQFLMDGYNTVIPLYWQSPIYKSNGFFLLEPSIFSQFSALAVVIELLFFERKWRLVVYAAGLLVTYSGTGLLLLVWAVPAIFIMKQQFWLVWLGLIGIAVLLAFSESLNLDVFARRLDEFGSERTSGFARFVAPWLLLDEYLVRDTVAFLVGKGPGTYLDYARGRYAMWAGYQPHDPTWAKLVFEYGLIGFVAFMAFIVYCLFAGAPSRFLALALLFGYLAFGGALLKIWYHAVIIVLALLPGRETEGVAVAEPPSSPSSARSGTPRLLRRM